MIFDPGRITTTLARQRVRNVRNVCAMLGTLILIGLVSTRLGLGYFHGWREFLLAGWSQWPLFALIVMVALFALTTYAGRVLFFVRYPAQWDRKLARRAARAARRNAANVEELDPGEVEILAHAAHHGPAVEDVVPVQREPVAPRTRPAPGAGVAEYPGRVQRKIRTRDAQ